MFVEKSRKIYAADLATKLQIKFVFLNFLNFFLNVETFKRKNLWVPQQVLSERPRKTCICHSQNKVALIYFRTLRKVKCDFWTLIFLHGADIPPALETSAMQKISVQESHFTFRNVQN